MLRNIQISSEIRFITFVLADFYENIMFVQYVLSLQ
jgi:hypothetical protein